MDASPTRRSCMINRALLNSLLITPSKSSCFLVLFDVSFRLERNGGRNSAYSHPGRAAHSFAWTVFLHSLLFERRHRIHDGSFGNTGAPFIRWREVVPSTKPSTCTLLIRPPCIRCEKEPFTVSRHSGFPLYSIEAFVCRPAVEFVTRCSVTRVGVP